MKRLLVLSLSLAVSAFAGGTDWTLIWDINRPTFAPANKVTSNVISTATTNGATYGSFVEWFKSDKVSLTNTVNEIAKAGLLCEVLGHRWEHGCGIEARGFGCLVNHGPARHCSVCNKEQYKKPEEWE